MPLALAIAACAGRAPASGDVGEGEGEGEGEPAISAWMRAIDAFPIMGGPVGVEDDFVFIRQFQPCTIERASADGETIWERTLEGTLCESITRAGDLIVVAGGPLVLLDVDGFVFDVLSFAGGRSAVSGTPDHIDSLWTGGEHLRVRQHSLDGSVLRSYDIVGLQADAAYQSFIASLDGGDVVVSVNVQLSDPVAVPDLGGSPVTVPRTNGGSDGLVLRLAAGHVRSAFLIERGSLNYAASRGDELIVCGGTQGRVRSLVDGEEFEPPPAPADDPDAQAGFVITNDRDGESVVSFEAARPSYVTVCAPEPDGALLTLVASVSATGRELTLVREPQAGAPVQKQILSSSEGQLFAAGIWPGPEVVVVNAMAEPGATAFLPQLPPVPTAGPFDQVPLLFGMPRTALGFP